MDDVRSELTSLKLRVDQMKLKVNQQLDAAEYLNQTVKQLENLFEEHDRETENIIAEHREEISEDIGNTLSGLFSLKADLESVAGELICGGVGWRRAVYLDMSDAETECPSGWNYTEYSNGIRTCGRASDGHVTCDSVFFPVIGGAYSEVCGTIRAYQWGWTTAFLGNVYGLTVDEAYATGVAVLRGTPRQHVWTFAAGPAEGWTDNKPGLCPCDTAHSIQIPDFVGSDYFCESGYVWPGSFIDDEVYTLHSNDTLWDGKDCEPSSTCCTLNGPPYFNKVLNGSSTDDLELRLCSTYFGAHHDNIAVTNIELYVK